jgi:hypothetical protein
MDREDGLNNVFGGSEKWELKFKYWSKCNLANPLTKKTLFKWESSTLGKLDYSPNIFQTKKPSKLPLSEPSTIITCFSLKTSLNSTANKALCPVHISRKTASNNLKIRPKLNFPNHNFKWTNNRKISTKLSKKSCCHNS